MEGCIATQCIGCDTCLCELNAVADEPALKVGKLPGLWVKLQPQNCRAQRECLRLAEGCCGEIARSGRNIEGFAMPVKNRDIRQAP